MPSGVFKPYAGVSTAVLVFTKTNSGGTDKVWFYDMQADGFSLDDKRSPIAENDIPDVVNRFHNLADEANRSRKEQSFMVPVDEIREKVTYEPVNDILSRLKANEADYLSGYNALMEMLEEGANE